MNFLKVLPVILSSLVLGAHFLRAESGFLVLVSLAMPFLLLVREQWAARVVQLFLFLGSFEWMRTMLGLLSEYRESGREPSRMVAIMVSVALFTLASAFVFRSRSLAKRYGLGEGKDVPDGPHEDGPREDGRPCGTDEADQTGGGAGPA